MKEDYRIKWLDSIDSTNNETIRQAHSLDNLSVLAAYRQTAGRGQRGNTWLSQPGENLTFSLFLRFGPDGLAPVPASQQFLISEMITLTLTDFLAQCGVRGAIKWPNDIYVRDKKICGVLIESGLDGSHLAWSVVGVGLNLNQQDFPPQLVNPTSLARLTKRQWPLEESLENIMRISLKYIRLMNTDDGREKLREQYLEQLYRKDTRSPFVDARTGDPFEGTIRGPSPQAKLLVELSTGECKEFDFKEISYII